MTRSPEFDYGRGQPRRTPTYGAVNHRAQNSSRRVRPKRSNLVLTALLWAVVSVAALAVATATFLAVAAPTDILRDRIVQEVRERTGRDLSIAGGTSLTFFPHVGLSLQNVSLSPPPHLQGDRFAHVEQIDVRIPLSRLLRGELAVEQIFLRRPEIYLVVDADGRRSWSFARQGQASDSIARKANSAIQPSEPIAALAAMAAVNLRVEDGIVHYTDERRQVSEKITGLNLQVDLPSADSALEARGELQFRGEKLSLRAKIDSPAALLASRDSNFSVRVNSTLITASYDGTLAISPAPKAVGKLKVDASSLHGLTTWLGTGIVEDEEDGHFTLSGRLDVSEAAIALLDAKAQIGSNTVSGLAVIESRPDARPRLSADLQLSSLDLGRWLSAKETPRKGRAAIEGAPRRDDQASPQTIEDLLRGTEVEGPQVRGFIAREGWSDRPFNFEKLGLFDADVRLNIDEVQYRYLKAGTTRITATLTDRVLDTSINEMQLYGGFGRGTVQLNAAESAPALQVNFEVQNVSAFDLLRDAAEFDWIAGEGRILLAFTGTGQTEREFVETLNGRAEFDFRDGALVGFDIPAAIEGLQRGIIPEFERNGAKKTNFSVLTASFDIKDGIASNRDLRMVSKIMEVTGAGRADLPRRTLDYTIRPKLAASTNSSNDKPSGLELPVRITGPWSNPKYSADFDAVLKNSDQVIDTVKEIGKQFKGKNLGDAVQELLGDEKKRKETKRKARDLLKQFLKQ